MIENLDSRIDCLNKNIVVYLTNEIYIVYNILCFDMFYLKSSGDSEA